MGGHDGSDGLCNARPILGDVTNRPLKRGFPLISSDLELIPSDGYGDEVGTEDGDSKFAKQVCLGVENLVKEKCRAQLGSKENQSRASSPNCAGPIDASGKNISSADERKPDETKEGANLLDGGNTKVQGAAELSYATRNICFSSVLTPTCSQLSTEDSVNEVRVVSDGEQINNSTDERLASRNDEKGLGFGSIVSSKGVSTECSKLPKAQSSFPFELGSCVGLSNDECTSLNVGVDMLKACSCSFCLKAAYIWSDLHYQDIKGRISVLKKSQKEATLLVQKIGRGKQTDVHSGGSNSVSPKLESDLTNQWRSLFVNMEDIFGRENTQLQASYMALKDLRENCKMDLERTTGMPSDRR